MLTPLNLVAVARLTLGLGVTALAVLLLGPFQGAEHLINLDDKSAHALAFACITVTAFVAFPRLRRWDMALALIALGGALEVAQTLAGRDGEIGDLVADSIGCLAIYLPSKIENLRALARERGHESFAAIRAGDRRLKRRRTRVQGEAKPVLAPQA